jgi:hypothetical protein
VSVTKAEGAVVDEFMEFIVMIRSAARFAHSIEASENEERGGFWLTINNKAR